MTLLSQGGHSIWPSFQKFTTVLLEERRKGIESVYNLWCVFGPVSLRASQEDRYFLGIWTLPAMRSRRSKKYRKPCRSHNICTYVFQKGFEASGLPDWGLRIYWMKNKKNGFITALSRTELGRICKVVSNFLSTGQLEHVLILAGCWSRSSSSSAIFKGAT